ncbi:MAG: SEC-C domain-containing protein [Betaproteobacteria bacterium]|nr:SEC-C domain-containing protein [Betaproteobacteria bacterium]
MKVGRNDPCPCGSGKKYKHCCMNQDENVDSSPEDLAWRRLRRAVDSLPTDLLRFAEGYFGHAGLPEAWDEFTSWEGVPFDAGSPHIPVFMPWFYYDWMPDSHETGVRAEARAELTAAQAYLLKKGKSLDPLARRYLEACVAAPLSFYDVVTCEPGRGFTLRDIITGEACEVSERSASRGVQAGDILFAKIARLEDIALLEVLGTVIIPPDRKAPILELRARIRDSGTPLTPGALREVNIEFIEVYLGLADALLEPRLPEMRNTDGDPLSFHKLVFEIESPRAAFDALKDLALDVDDAELLAEAEFDRHEALRRVQFPWKTRGNPVNKSWDNTVLGNLTIDGARLTAEVNSRERALRIRKLIEDRLGAGVKHRATEIQAIETMLARAREKGGGAAARARDAEHERLAALPEVRAALQEHLRRHFESWIDQENPALGGRTPRQAMADPDGREMVEALVVQAERHGRKMQPPMDESIIRDLRVRLGLA